MRVAFKTLKGVVIDDLSTGEFNLKFIGRADVVDEVHPCADISLTVTSSSGDQSMAFAKDWDKTYDQMVDIFAQGALTVKQSDPTVMCEIAY
jgi:hypothetical protein